MIICLSPCTGVVDLADKMYPICELDDAEELADKHKNSEDATYAYTRGVVDVSEFKSYLESLQQQDWEDENQEGNVNLKRPAHDAWGIKKIMFTFCDDFLLKVLDLPYSQDSKWRKFLLPIYSAIGIEEKQVVRSLLASMPPGMSIPVHHDTGYWVKHTHRLHVAIISGDKVDFLIGPTNDSLKKYNFDEGRIVELNNQAKHAVTNGMTDKWRVHLIFDYVDTHPVNRFLLKPGEVVYQTRRSIDLKREEGSCPAPTFIIIGAQKCGTTSIYEYLCQHPLVLKGCRRETHYFDWRWNNKIPDTDGARHLEYYMNFYDKKALHKHSSLITGESTPSYLLHSDIVIPRIKLTCPWVKLIVVMRNPVHRAFSQYNMCVDQEGTPEQLQVRGMSSYVNKSFEDVIKAEIAELNVLNINPSTSYEYFHSNYVNKQPLTHGGHSIVARGLYALQLQHWMVSFGSDQLLVMSIDDIKGGKRKVQSNMDRLFAFVGIPTHDIVDLDAKNTRQYSSMSPAARALLEEYYAPFNDKLFQMLDRQLTW